MQISSTQRKIGLFVVLPIGLYALFAFWGSNASEARQQNADQARSVELASVQLQSVETVIEITGTLFGNEEATIGAKVPGRLLQNHVDVGDRVLPSALLAKIEERDYQLVVEQRRMTLREAAAKLGLEGDPPEKFNVLKVATVERAKLQEQNARTRLERAKQLFEAKPPLLSEQDYQDLQTGHEVAKRDYDVAVLQANAELALVRTRASELEAAEQRLTDTKVMAPIAPGIEGEYTYAIARRYVSPGEYVQEAAPLFDLVLDDPIKFQASVPERFLEQLQLKQTVSVSVESYQKPFTGIIKRISPAISPQSRSFEIEVMVSNAEGLLKSGAFARGRVITGARENVPFVPKSAVVSFAGIDRVFSVVDGAAIEHKVTLGVEREGRVAILTGLSDVDAVVSVGADKLSQGQAVVVAGSDAPSAAK